MWAGGTTNSTVPLESFLSTISLCLRERESFLNNKLRGEAEGGEEEEEEEKGGGGGGGGGEHRIDNRIGLRLRERERERERWGST